MIVDLVEILDGVGEAVIVTDPVGNIQLVNKMAEALAAESKDKLLGRPLAEIIYPQCGWKDLASLLESVSNGDTKVWSAERVTLPCGKQKIVQAQFAPILAGGASFRGIVITLRDITELLQEMEQLRLDSALLESLLNNIPDTIYFKDREGRFTRINRAQADMLGVKSPEEAVGKTDFDFFTPEHARSAWEDEQEILTTGRPLLDKTELVRRADGDFRWVSASKVPIRGENGEITGIVGISRDITERKLVEEELTYLNFHDKLTGLYNRAYFEEELRRLDVERMLPLSIVMGDLNGLKIINDAFGHDAGDGLLRDVAGILKSCCRQEDMVARWGGDEFAILLPKTDSAAAEKICQRIRERFQQERWKYVRPGISLGVATKTVPSEDIKMTVKQADQAMYRDKLLENHSTRQMLMANLKRAVGEGTRLDELNLESLISLLARMVAIVDTYVDIAGDNGNQAVAQMALSELVRCLNYQYDANVMQQIYPASP